MKKHGMQMGPGGFGVTHGLKGGNHTPSSYDDGDQGGAHGVSAEWVNRMANSGGRKASPQRLGEFSAKMRSSSSTTKKASDFTPGNKSAERARKNVSNRAVASSAAELGGRQARGRTLNKREDKAWSKGRDSQEKKMSGWDRWKAKKGK